MLLGKLVVTEHNNTSTTSIQASSKKNVGNGGNLRTLWLVIIKCFLDGVVDTLILAAIQLAVSFSELYFARCYALKRSGTFALENKNYMFIVRSGVMMYLS